MTASPGPHREGVEQRSAEGPVAVIEVWASRRGYELVELAEATYIIGLPLKKFFICQAASKRTKYPNRVLRAPKP